MFIAVLSRFRLMVSTSVKIMIIKSGYIGRKWISAPERLVWRALYANIFAVRLRIAYRVYMLHSALDYCRFDAGPTIVAAEGDQAAHASCFFQERSGVECWLCADVMLCFALVVEYCACYKDVCSLRYFMFCVVFFTALRNEYVR